MDEDRLDAGADETEARARSAEERARSLAGRLAVERCARQMGIVDEDAAFRLLDMSRMIFDEDGTATNAGELLGELVEERPWLRGTTDGVSVANPSRGAKPLGMREIRQMTPEEINANWDLVQAALRRGV